MNEPVLTTENLRIGYSGRGGVRRIIADHLNLTLRSGEVVCLMGPNGVGKSTLLRTLIGMQPPLAGRVFLDKTDLATLKPREIARRISVVLTERIEVGQLSVYNLVALGRYPYTNWFGRLTPHDEAIVQTAIAATQAEHLARRYIHELSDGERQRVMVARALAQEPQVMVLDEPTAFLDLPHRVAMMQLLRRLAHDTQRAVILSTHDLDLALRSADIVWLMTTDGTVYSGAPEDLVLSGAFEKAFANCEITFDRYHGQFRFHYSSVHRATLLGEGLIRKWTSHALERIGYLTSSTDNPTALRITISGTEQQPCWHIQAKGHPERCVYSLHDLVTLVREMSPSGN
jgi:iron complex transport system ATP-binding protein